MRLFISCLMCLFTLSLQAEDMPQTLIPPMPEPHANNAVATVTREGVPYIVSFMGLKPGKTWRDVSKAVHVYDGGRKVWRTVDMPVELGRLAATAETVGGLIYIFGGYTVAEDHSEVSTPEVYAFDPVTLRFSRRADMPLPVDDTVSFVYRNRYIYLVSGWHDTGNVAAVQIYDTQTDSWQQATDYPGSPVFGHAGGIVGNRFVIADGVAVLGKDGEGRRIFDTVSEGWMGTIDPSDRTKITWKRLPQLPGRGHYRMAASGDVDANRVIFVGGTSTAYNYSGTGYDGTPAKASAHAFAWDFTRETWTVLPDAQTPTMDHRGLLRMDDTWIVVGGMRAEQTIAADVLPVWP